MNLNETLEAQKWMFPVAKQLNIQLTKENEQTYKYVPIRVALNNKPHSYYKKKYIWVGS